jgi:hypothetical protein
MKSGNMYTSKDISCLLIADKMSKDLQALILFLRETAPSMRRPGSMTLDNSYNSNVGNEPYVSVTICRSCRFEDDDYEDGKYTVSITFDGKIQAVVDEYLYGETADLLECGGN